MSDPKLIRESWDRMEPYGQPATPVADKDAVRARNVKALADELRQWNPSDGEWNEARAAYLVDRGWRLSRVVVSVDRDDETPPDTLDAAWKAVEQALPKGRRLAGLEWQFDGRWQAYSIADGRDLLVIEAYGDTPQAALRALLNATPPDKRCGSFGCTLPAGHNMGKADIPANHATPSASSLEDKSDEV